MCVLSLRFRFSETDTYMELFSLHVVVTEPDCSVIRLGPKSLEVPEFYGLSGAIDRDVLSFHYDRRSSVECTVHVDTHDTHLPAHGQLVTGEPRQAAARGDEPESFTPLLQQLGGGLFFYILYGRGRNIGTLAYEDPTFNCL